MAVLKIQHKVIIFVGFLKFFVKGNTNTGYACIPGADLPVFQFVFGKGYFYRKFYYLCTAFNKGCS
jgi:hypothetical protein